MKKIIIISLVLAIFLLSGCTTVKNWFLETPEISPNVTGATPITPSEGNESETKTDTIAETATPEEVVSEEDIVATIKAKEGDLITIESITSKIKDPEGKKLTFTYTTPFDKYGDWQTKVGDAGTRIITVAASDGQNTADFSVKVIVQSKNKAPVLTVIAPITVKEGQRVVLNPIVKDPEGDPLTYTYSGWMTTNDYVTRYGDAGDHIVKVTISDSINQVSQDVKITVTKVNRAPVISLAAKTVTVTEGQVANIAATATDPDGDKVTIAYGAPFDSDGTWSTREGDFGTKDVIITASDGQTSSTETVSVVVKSLIKPPVIQTLSDIVVGENDKVLIIIKATDPQGRGLTYTINNARFVKDAINPNEFLWQTGYDDSGVYDITATVSNGKQSSTASFKLTINNVNRPPVFVG